MKRIAWLTLLIPIFFYMTIIYANTFNFALMGSLPTSVAPGETVTATYQVTSPGTFSADDYHLILAMLSNPDNVSLDTTIANACTINPITPSGCILQLNIVGPVSGPVKICDDWQDMPGVNCYIPADRDTFLNVTADQSPLLTASPSSTFLAPNESQTFTVVNTSTTTTATNVTITIPTNVSAQLAGSPVYDGCASIAPSGTCTITITATATATAQSGTIMTPAI